MSKKARSLVFKITVYYINFAHFLMILCIRYFLFDKNFSNGQRGAQTNARNDMVFVFNFFCIRCRSF